MKTPPVYRFLMVCRAGPVLRTFSSPSAFDGYVRGFRSACGFSSGAAGFSDGDMLAIDQLILSHSEIHRAFSIQFDGDVFTFHTVEDLPESPEGFPFGDVGLSAGTSDF